ncbi:hypothetical protein BZG35_11040 [Brevundimonas sp. LM2]|uniref:polysaccharide deacetylase family protein n=1 Tax=Brevundimonas sp. LM2 TaxID=1938605 RepID=UPI0009839710|nr:polysaccharide deacetylase family protein [Brevundimonas sp. LM2]AQR62119.1 hypothetical protein BZG35_11040 [Brevundimonas sp. LM2]
MIARRQVLTGLAAGSAVVLAGGARAYSPSDGPRFAITLDDFRFEDGPGLTGAQRHRAILDALDAGGIQAAGLITGRHVDNPAASAHLAAWSEAGHAIGNHTYSHASFGRAEPGDLGGEIDQTAVLISAHPTWRPWFRFPYLAEGRTPTLRDRFRADLRQRDLHNAYVTIDASDWYVNQRLQARLAHDPGADVTPYGDYLIAHLLDRARFYDGLARDVLGSSPPHTLLLHHMLTTALFLPRILEAFRLAGWTAIDADVAYADPVYRSQPDIAPCANSLIWQLAKADGRFDARLRSPGEDGPYEAAAMDARGL